MKKRAVLLFLALSLFINASEYTLDELDQLRALNLLNEEDYELLKAELKGEASGEALYNLKVNGTPVSNVYPVIREEGTEYFPILEFFRIIGFRNYVLQDGVLEMYIGTDLHRYVINGEKKIILGIKGREKAAYTDEEIILHEGEFYIEKSLFSRMFLKGIDVNNEEYRVSMGLSFETPSEIKRYLRNVEERLSEEREELIFTNVRKPFDLGYMRLDFQGGLFKDGGTKSFEKDWTGRIEYQGGFLYGQFTGAYDVKNSEPGDVDLYYPEIWKQHSFEIGNHGGGAAREWEVSFRKEKGYYREGKNFVIRENVPIGSKVELLYMGYPIEVKDAEDGIIEFSNSEIKENRSYTLRVYTPEGKILIIEVNTAADYNQQNKGELEYDFSVRENHEHKRFAAHFNTYYGITENLTGGISYFRNVEEGEDSVGYADSVRVEGVYSDYVKRFPYTLVLGGEKVISSPDSQSGRYMLDYKGQIDIYTMKFLAERETYGNYYDDKKYTSYSAQYSPVGPFRLDYTWEKTEYYEKDLETDSSFGVNFSYGFKNLLVTADYENSRNNPDAYELNFYYSGLNRYNIQIANNWSAKGDYEGILSIMNKNLLDIFDYTFEIGYSQSDKEKFTLRFTMDYDNWFRAEGTRDRNGSQRYTAGINRVVDLKNISKTIESMDSSRVKVITFVDRNGNSVMDSDEKLLDNVVVKIGSQEAVTERDGTAWLYGVPNEIIYDLKPTIRKPSYTMGSTNIKVRGNHTGTIEAYIPVKPMITLSGIFIFDPRLGFSETEQKRLYENTIIRIKDSAGKTVETINPESDGSFEVSGLFTETYRVEIMYLGTDYNIEGVVEDVKLMYLGEERNNYKVKYMGGRFSLEKEDEKEG